MATGMRFHTSTSDQKLPTILLRSIFTAIKKSDGARTFRWDIDMRETDAAVRKFKVKPPGRPSVTCMTS